MNATERIYRIDSLLKEHTVVPISTFLRELGVSRATFKRDLDTMRDRFNAPIDYDRDNEGYRFREGGQVGPKYQLPGLWFTPQEALALLTMHQLLESMNPSLLGSHVKPLQARIQSLLSHGDREIREVRRRIRLITLGARKFDPRIFEMVATSVLERRRLFVFYYHKGEDRTSRREISPQRLVHYRNNWYLDAWCHVRNDVRSFALDGIREVAMQDAKAKEVAEADLDEILKAGYGIFSGKKVKWATLRFAPPIARWVALETWHQKQRARFEKDGSYVLEVPYSHERELSMDILRFGADCRVEAPADLRDSIREQRKRALEAS